MVIPLRPPRGGYLRPFGCGAFIRDFLAGRSPNGSPKIDPSVGAPMADVFYEYKGALHRAFAEDMVATEEERRARRKRPPLTVEEADRLKSYYMERIPLKFTRARYSSFTRYFDHLKRLRWVERTGKEEPSAIQDDYPEAPPRVYYRLTDAGRTASEAAWSNPLLALYGDRWGGEEAARSHLRELRKQHHYSRRVPTKRRPAKV